MNYMVADEAVIDLYAPIERAVLAKYLDAVDPRPADLRTFDVSKPVPARWSEQKDGIGPRRSAFGSKRLMLQNAVARICLEAVAAELPQWAEVRDGVVITGRPLAPVTTRGRALAPRHLFTINWADSRPGFSWPEAYYVTLASGYGTSVVTASADSPDATGHCDVAVGWYRGPASDLEQVREAVRTHWASLKRQSQGRWAYLFREGALDELEANAIGDLVWSLVLEKGVS